MFRLLKARTQTLGHSVLLCSHDPNMALRHADRLLCLRDGRLIHNLAVSAVAQAQLVSAVRDVYGPVDLVPHRGGYLIAEGV
jgi:ABC-type cobalamin/Fe3+-siderophores transport system ATPase subunit